MAEPNGWLERRRAMVATQIEARNLDDPEVLAAMRTVPRHSFVPDLLRDRAYDDSALPIGPQQTISQPYIVALIAALAIEGSRDRILEIGTGTGYQAAVLAELFGRVFTVELDADLAERARARLESLHYNTVQVLAGDGRLGWREHAPYDAIVVTAATTAAPPSLTAQLAPGGRLIYPREVPGADQTLTVVTRIDGEVEERTVAPVRFVPLK